jgi:wyosine [tRNA(Phe)-imidazoG37] synthetase (radical SAM superfamily)
MASLFDRVLGSLGLKKNSARSSISDPELLPSKGSDADLRSRLNKIHEWTVEEVLTELEFYNLEQIQRVCADDSWLSNYLTNLWEYKHGTTELNTYPWNVCLPIVDVCNAACTFCNSWLRGKRWLKREELESFAPLIKNSKLLGLAGHGEPLIHPEFEEMSQRFAELIDERCSVYLITNGYLLNRYESQLEAMNVRTYNISLNGCSPETHDEIMGLGPDGYERVLAALKTLIEKRNAGANTLINISMVVVKQNLHEVVPFIELGNELGVNNLYIRTLRTSESYAVAGLNYHSLAARDHPEFSRLAREAKAAIQNSRVPVESDPGTWALPLFSEKDAEYLKQNPPVELSRDEARSDPEVKQIYDDMYAKYSGGALRGQELTQRPSQADLFGTENPFDRSPRYLCEFVYFNLCLNDFEFKLVPCCYMENVPGFEINTFDGQFDFFEAWNSPAFVELRRSLVSGPMLGPCKTCPTQGIVPIKWQDPSEKGALGLTVQLTNNKSSKLIPAADDKAYSLLKNWSAINFQNGQTFEERDDGLHVKTSSNAYDWSSHSTEFIADKAGIYSFALKFRRDYGDISFGIIDKEKNDWTVRTTNNFVDGPSFVRIASTELAAGQTVQLLIANNNRAARPTRFVIEDTRAYYQSS